jgi:hypothetical protein
MGGTIVGFRRETQIGIAERQFSYRCDPQARTAVVRDRPGLRRLENGRHSKHLGV